jgi:hypothetical protein
MAALSWWRSWHGAPMDPKWQAIAARSGVKVGIVSAVAWALIDYASQHENRGTVDGFDTEVYAVYSGFPEVEIVAVIRAMTDKGVIVAGRLANWEKRQPKREDETSTERVREFREREKQMKRNETQGNAPEEIEIKETDKEAEESKPADPADLIQDTLISNGVIPTGEDDMKAIGELVTAGVIPEDVIAGIAWKAKNNGSKIIRYVSQVVGPAKTAMAKRKQTGANYQPPQLTEEELRKSIII